MSIQKKNLSTDMAAKQFCGLALLVGSLALSGCGLFGAETPAEKPPLPVRSVLAGKDVDPKAEQLHAKARILWGTEDVCSDPEQAIAFLNSALEIEPDYPDALLRRGLAFAQLGHPEDAFEDLTKAIRIVPTAELYAWRAQILLGEGMLKGALQDADEALRLGPASPQRRDDATPRAHNVRGAVLLEEGRNDAACAEFKVAASAGVDFYLKKSIEAGICK